MTKQILMTLLSFFLGAKADHAVANNAQGVVDLVKENIRAEVSAIIFRSLMGLVIAITTIFALLQLGRALQIIFNRSPYGPYFEVVTFGAVAVAGFYVMLQLFRPPPRIIIESSSPVEGLDIPGLLQRFSHGLLKGYMNGSTSKSNTNTHRTLEADF
ncbi:MAG: hypothetical protein K0R29_481 [Pseudobdellovibrio sp.]|jgi:hypothetical protein|nr:hypothetical protein [Pseudobdellovibrio sp.]